VEDEISRLSRIVEEHEKRIEKLESRTSLGDGVSVPKTGDSQDVVALFKALDLNDYDYINDFSGLELFLVILHIARLELDVDGLTPPEISRICKEKVRVSAGVDRTTISNMLSNAGGKVDRMDNPRGRGFAYRIMKSGEKHVEDARSGLTLLP
jgi:hypothetical protein